MLVVDWDLFGFVRKTDRCPKIWINKILAREIFPLASCCWCSVWSKVGCQWNKTVTFLLLLMKIARSLELFVEVEIMRENEGIAARLHDNNEVATEASSVPVMTANHEDHHHIT